LEGIKRARFAGFGFGRVQTALNITIDPVILLEIYRAAVNGMVYRFQVIFPL
jgi:hypothetical protein